MAGRLGRARPIQERNRRPHDRTDSKRAGRLPLLRRARRRRGDRLTRSLPLGGERVQILNGVSFRSARRVGRAHRAARGRASPPARHHGRAGFATGGRICIDGVDITGMAESQLARIAIKDRHRLPVVQPDPFADGAGERRGAALCAGWAPPARRAGARDAGAGGPGARRGHRPHQLSGGEQQRVAIARALVTEPTLLLADEPTGNLGHAPRGEQVLDLFSRLRASPGVTLIIATHDPAMAARADQRTAHGGRRLDRCGGPARRASCPSGRPGAGDEHPVLPALCARALPRGGQRTSLALLCVAFGVMSLVAMQLLAGLIHKPWWAIRAW